MCSTKIDRLFVGFFSGACCFFLPLSVFEWLFLLFFIVLLLVWLCFCYFYLFFIMFVSFCFVCLVCCLFFVCLCVLLRVTIGYVCHCRPAFWWILLVCDCFLVPTGLHFCTFFVFFVFLGVLCCVYHDLFTQNSSYVAPSSHSSSSSSMLLNAKGHKKDEKNLTCLGFRVWPFLWFKHIFPHRILGLGFGKVSCLCLVLCLVLPLLVLICVYFLFAVCSSFLVFLFVAWFLFRGWLLCWFFVHFLCCF